MSAKHVSFMPLYLWRLAAKHEGEIRMHLRWAPAATLVMWLASLPCRRLIIRFMPGCLAERALISPYVFLGICSTTSAHITGHGSAYRRMYRGSVGHRLA